MMQFNFNGKESNDMGILAVNIFAVPQFEIDVDSVLDEYNDNMTLYNMFGDEEYKLKAKEVLELLE